MSSTVVSTAPPVGWGNRFGVVRSAAGVGERR